RRLPRPSEEARARAGRRPRYRGGDEADAGEACASTPVNLAHRYRSPAAKATSVLAESGDRHGLVVELAARFRSGGTDLAVGVEASEGRSSPHHLLDALDLFLGALLQNQLATHAAD